MKLNIIKDQQLLEIKDQAWSTTKESFNQN